MEKGRRLVRQEGGIAEGEAKIVRKQREGHFRRRGLSSTESRRLECHATYARTAGLCTWSSKFSRISFTGSPTYAALTYTGTDTSGAGLGAVEASKSTDRLPPVPKAPGISTCEVTRNAPDVSGQPPIPPFAFASSTCFASFTLSRLLGSTVLDGRSPDGTAYHHLGYLRRLLGYGAQ